ncbi:MAG: Maf-like protein [Flavobacteriaceae bacterium]|nr:Maf-like protein [Flavobacteriaceae bacterium]
MLSEKLSQYHIILASGSPRRQQFLEELNLNFTIQLKDTDENYPKHLQGAEIADYLAVLKAKAFQSELKENDLLITADTIVWLDGKSLAKSENKEEAVKMLQELSGKTHEVISACCITTIQFQKVFHEVTKVHFKELSDEEIEFYVTNFNPFDKAGSYGIQEWIGYSGIEKIEGSFFNVMGFPVFKFYKALQEL